jgi:NAD(P)H dehydrogenase (quinone)
MTHQNTQSGGKVRHVIVLGHPATDSFNHAVANRYCTAVRDSGHEATVRDLYALDFDPRLQEARRPGHQTGMSADVANELGHLRAADVVVLVYPIWFGMPPAMIKGYIDRVMGVSLTPAALQQNRPDSILHGKKLAILSSSGTTLAWLDEHGQMSAMRQAFDAYLRTIFGMRDGGHVHFDAIVEGLAPSIFERNMLTVEETARTLCSGIAAERRAGTHDIGGVS